jgi:hypothetical protein
MLPGSTGLIATVMARRALRKAAARPSRNGLRSTPSRASNTLRETVRRRSRPRDLHYLALKLERPLFVEASRSGKTEIAGVLADILGRPDSPPVLRGIDASRPSTNGATPAR